MVNVTDAFGGDVQFPPQFAGQLTEAGMLRHAKPGQLAELLDAAGLHPVTPRNRHDNPHRDFLQLDRIDVYVMVLAQIEPDIDFLLADLVENLTGHAMTDLDIDQGIAVDQ